MRIMAIDYGTKRIGVALSDELKMIAQPLEYIPAEPFARFLERLKTILAAQEVELILIGLPRNMDGSYGPSAENARTFAAALQNSVTTPIKMWDERLTTSQANRALIEGGMRRAKRREVVNQTAAAIMLQSYLDAPR